MRTLPRLALFASLLTTSTAGSELPRLHLKPVVLKQLHSPTTITHAGDGSGRLFVCDQPGRIHIVRHGMLWPTPFLDLSSTGLDRVVAAGTGYSERGLLGLAFHPDFATPSAPGEGRFYVYYSAPSASNPNPSVPQTHISIVSEFTVSATDPDHADPASERVLLAFGQPQNNHNGGQLEFGPDGLLYVGSGDGGSSDDNNAGHTGGDVTQPAGVLGNALDRTNLLGKILRIDPLGTNGPGAAYGIPATNPFSGEGGGVREEIYAYGLRNPWRFSFDKRAGGTDRLFCGDVGQGKVEEVNLITAGGNFGWRYREGSFEFDPAMVGSGNAPLSSIDPIAEYAHPNVTIGTPALPQLGVSVTGGYVYRGAAIPALHGVYVFADYRASSGEGGRLMALEETGAEPPTGIFLLRPTIPLTEANPLSGGRRILTLGEDEAGELYLGTKTNGGVLQLDGGFPAGGLYRLVAAVPSTISLPADRDNSIFEGTSNSNGSGPHLYAGRTGSMGGSARRRALLRFDLADLGDDPEIVDASVVLHQDLGGSAPTTQTLHRLDADWGEAGSNAGSPGGEGAPAESGDATWTNRFHPGSPWNSSGGDFVSAPSASSLIDSTAPDGPVARSWSGPGLVADLEAWLASPATNFGWILLGDEVGSATAQRFASRENGDSGGAFRPRLEVTRLAPPGPSPFESFLETHFPGLPPGSFIDPQGDADGDGIPLLLEHGYGFHPHVADPPEETRLTLAVSSVSADLTRMTVTFRRNAAATDVKLTLKIGSELDSWTPVAESVAGAEATGLNGGVVVSDEEIPGSAPARIVTVEVLFPSSARARFARLEADLLP